MDEKQAQKQAQKQAEKQATAKAGATAAHIVADYYTGGEYEQIRNAPIVGDLAKRLKEKLVKSLQVCLVVKDLVK